MSRKRWRRLFFWTLIPPALLAGGLIVACNLWIVLSTRSLVHDDATAVEAREIGVVLGTSKKTGPDTPNRHFENRMAAAAALFRAGKVSRLLVSGYRDSDYYDETRDMIAKLKELGIPEEFLLSDDRGARTLDSMVRVKTVFGFDRIIIISDDFHVNRALFIASRCGIDAIALRSESIDYDNSRKVRLREYFARVKAVLDLYVRHPQAVGGTALPSSLVDRS